MPQPSIAQPTTNPTMTKGRKSVDCRAMPSDTNCSLKISGRPDEVLAAAMHHAITAHGHTDSPELAEAIKSSMKDDSD